MKDSDNLVKEILELKEQRQAIILAHNFIHFLMSILSVGKTASTRRNFFSRPGFAFKSILKRAVFPRNFFRVEGLI